MASVQNGSAYLVREPSFDEGLVRVGRGTPMGELLRRYWHPVLKSSKLSDLPVQVRALGEDIVLFRKPDGAVGAVYPRCAHRGTTLLYGKVTDQGIRCCYHGWTFDTDGRCTDMPCERDRGGKARNAIRQPWYPAQELYGLIFVYLGPLEHQPPLPRYDLLEAIPEGWEIDVDDTTIPATGAGKHDFNWLQSLENGVDWTHVKVVHENQFHPVMWKGESSFEATASETQVISHAISHYEGVTLDFRHGVVLPTVRIIPNPFLKFPRPDGKCDSIGFTLPVDDTNTIIFNVMTQPKGVQQFPPEVMKIYGGKYWHELDFEGHQRFPGDYEAQRGQGEITFHSEEHLVAGDKAIVLLRRMLKSAIKTMQEGGELPFTAPDKPVLIETDTYSRITGLLPE